MSEVVKSEIVDGVGYLTFAQAERRNAMTAELVEQSRAVHDDFVEAGVRVGVLAAEGPVFCAGGDLKAKRVPRVPPAGVRLIETFDSSPILWVAAVHAPALGAALHLLSTCPTVVMSQDAWFRVPEFLHGRFPRPVVAALAEVIGARRAMRMATSGERMTATQAFELGLVEHVVADTDVHVVACERAQTLAGIDADALAIAGEQWRIRLGLRPGV